MTVVYTPPGEHHCNPGWETRRAEDGHEYAHDVGSSDAPGTVRRCSCGRFWVAVKPLEVRGGQQLVGVEWRLEKRRERKRRERAQRPTRDEDPPSVAKLQAPPAVPGGYSGLRPASEVPPPSRVPTGSMTATVFRDGLPFVVPELRDGDTVALSGMEGLWRVVDEPKLTEDGCWHYRMEPVS